MDLIEEHHLEFPILAKSNCTIEDKNELNHMLYIF